MDTCTKPTTARIKYFDIAKGFTIILMVIGHMGLKGKGSYVNHFIYAFHMPLFFIMSGYFMSDRGSMGAYFKKKTKQLLLPYVFTCMAVCVLQVVKDILLHDKDILRHLLLWLYASAYGSGNDHTTPFYIKSIGAIWFLLALLSALMIVRFFMHRKYAWLYIILIAAVGYITSLYVWLPFSIQAGMVAGIYVYIGVLMKRKKVLHGDANKWILLFCLAVWLFCTLYGGELYMVRNYYGNGILDVICSVCITYFVVMMSKCVYMWNCRALKPVLALYTFWGEQSLQFVCFHLIDLNIFPFVWRMLRNVLTDYGVPQPAILAVILTGKVLYCTAGIWLVQRIIDRRRR